MNVGSNVRVVGGKFLSQLADKKGVVDKMLPGGGVVVGITKHDKEGNPSVSGYILSEDSLVEV